MYITAEAAIVGMSRLQTSQQPQGRPPQKKKSSHSAEVAAAHLLVVLAMNRNVEYCAKGRTPHTRHELALVEPAVRKTDEGIGGGVRM